MPCVVAWFCECGSSVRMSFCAAQRKVTACTGRATRTESRTSSRFMKPPLLDRKGFLDQRRQIAGAERDHVVVEIVVWIVQEAATHFPVIAAALAKPDVGAGA